MSSWKVKDKAPQAVKDIENEPEKIDVVDREGRLWAVATWREHKFEEPLPSGCQAWEPGEVKSVMRNTARRLKVLVGKAKWAAMAELAEQLSPIIETERELTELDYARIAEAQIKRQRRAAKRARLNA